MKFFFNKTSCVFWLLLVLFIVSRCVMLDSDIPLPGVSEYFALDECYYNHAAFNLYHYGEYAHRVIAYVDDIRVNNNVLENLITYLTLKIWGNNYYGLRMSSVLAATLIFIGIYIILLEPPFKRRVFKDVAAKAGGGESAFQPEENIGKAEAEKHAEEPKPYDKETELGDKQFGVIVPVLLIMLFFLIDFPFLMSGRIAEPTVFRMLAMVAVILVVVELNRRNITNSFSGSVLLGFLAFTTVFFVYIYNAFIFAALCLSVAAWNRPAGWQQVIKSVSAYLLGAILAFLCFMGFTHYVFDSSLSAFFDVLAPYSYRMTGYGQGMLANPRHYFMNLLAVFSTNLFRLNIAIMFLFIVSLPVTVCRAIREKEALVILFCNLTLLLILQCVVVNDFNFRKLIIIAPLVAAQILLAVGYSREFGRLLVRYPWAARMFSIYWLMGGCFFVLFMHLGSIKPALLNSQIIVNSNIQLPGDINRVNLAVFIIFFIIVTLFYLGNKTISRKWMAFAMVVLLIPGLYLNTRYVYLNPTYCIRDNMIAMRDKVDDKVIAGGVGYGFRLYNTSTPVLDFYRFAESRYDNPHQEYLKIIRRIFREGRADYTLQIRMSNPKDEIKYGRERGLVVVKRYDTVTLYGKPGSE